MASGKLRFCDKLPVKFCTAGEATVKTVVPAAVAVVAVPKAMLLIVVFWLASRNITLLAPVEAVTPVPPAATGKVPAAKAELDVEYKA